MSHMPTLPLTTPISPTLQTAEPPHWEDGRFVFQLQRSPLCEYLINFIRKLQTLPEKPMMDSVLENFTILQVFGEGNEGPICALSIFLPLFPSLGEEKAE